MTAMPSRPDGRWCARTWAGRAAWALVGCAAACDVLWGYVGGLCIANDDLKFVRMPARELPLTEAMAFAWRNDPSFRPLEVAMAHLSDPVTLACPWVAPVQAAGLATLLGGTVALARLALPGLPALWPITALLVLLSPATTASLWQMDSCSQTWSAALGAWSVWMAWRWIDGAARRSASWGILAALCAAVLCGLTIKENFYGWALGLAAASIVSVAVLARRHSASVARAAWVLVPVVALPLAHLMCRMRWSALAGLLDASGDGSRYQAEFGANLLLNSAVSLAGAVGMGPFHLVMDSEAHPALRALPILATCALVLVVLLGAVTAALERRAASGVRWHALLFCALASMLSLAATIPMPAVSELYGLGANIGCALLAAGAIAALWQPGDGAHHRAMRTAISVSVAASVAIGAYGLASRAEHFRVVWTTVRALNDAIVLFQAALPAARASDAGPAGMVHVPTACLVGVTHSQYVMPPLQALDLNLTEEWLARRDPSRRIVFSIGTAPTRPRANEMVLDCAALPQHGHW